MRRISLTQGQFAIVNDEDYDFLMQWKWYARRGRKTWYAARGEPYPDGRLRKNGAKMQRTVLMHRIISQAVSGQHIDHRNCNGLDNRRRNLRVCTNGQNQQNRLPQKNCSSSYKGVSWKKQSRKWFAQIGRNSKNYFLGYFHIEIDAARAYDKKAKELFGEFAHLNFKET